MEKINDFNLLQTPCFILDGDELKRSVQGFGTALKQNFNKAIVGYSVKTNATPYCLNLANKFGTYAEVVSYDEYELAITCGFSRNRIIYNGPMKSKDTFLDAIQQGAIVNIETKREIDWLKDLPYDKIYQVGIRLNINISQISPEDADGDDDNSRFGFTVATGEFEKAVQNIESLPHVKIGGLHVHRTAHSRSIRFYKHSIDYACKVIEKYGLNLNYIDIGGGFFGIFPNKPTYKDYSDAFYEILKKHHLDHLCVVVEPGNALVASCFQFLSEVIDTKQVEKGLWFITTDGSRNDIDPFFKKSSYLNELLYNKRSLNVVPEQIVSGCTCLEYDRMFILKEKNLLQVGDRILYHNVGAYTTCLSPMFIRYFPNIYVFEDNHYRLIRKKWSAENFLQESIF